MVLSVEEALRRSQIDNVKSQQAIRRSRNLTLGSKQKIAKAQGPNAAKKAAKAAESEAGRNTLLEKASEVRRLAREARAKSKQVHSKSKQVREALSRRKGNSHP